MPCSTWQNPATSAFSPNFGVFQLEPFSEIVLPDIDPDFIGRRLVRQRKWTFLDRAGTHHIGLELAKSKPFGSEFRCTDTHVPGLEREPFPHACGRARIRIAG